MMYVRGLSGVRCGVPVRAAARGWCCELVGVYVSFEVPGVLVGYGGLLWVCKLVDGSVWIPVSGKGARLVSVFL